MKRTLRMKFGADDGRTARFSLLHCKESVSAQEAGAAMDTMIASRIFSAGLGEKRGASVAEIKETVLF